MTWITLIILLQSNVCCEMHADKVNTIMATAVISGSRPPNRTIHLATPRNVTETPNSVIPIHSKHLFGRPRASPIQRDPTLDLTWLWLVEAMTQDLKGCSVVFGTRMLLVVLSVVMRGLHRADLFQHIPPYPGLATAIEECCCHEGSYLNWNNVWVGDAC